MYDYYNRSSLTHDFGLGNFLGTIGAVVIIGLGAMLWLSVLVVVRLARWLLAFAAR